MKTRLYIVTRPDYPEDRDHVIVEARDREEAKRTAHRELGYVADKYIVEPLPTPPGKPGRIIWVFKP